MSQSDFSRVSTFAGHRIRKLEWGLWRDVDRPGHYFLCWRPDGRNAALVRRWAYADGVRLAV